MATYTTKTKRIPSAARSNKNKSVSGNEHHSDSYYTTKMVDTLG